MSFDIKTAFLHAKLTLDIYCRQTPSFPEANPHTVLHFSCTGSLAIFLQALDAPVEDYDMSGLIHCKVNHTIFSG